MAREMTKVLTTVRSILNKQQQSQRKANGEVALNQKCHEEEAQLALNIKCHEIGKINDI
jgi:hypothetical protein